MDVDEFVFVIQLHDSLWNEMWYIEKNTNIFSGMLCGEEDCSDQMCHILKNAFSGLLFIYICCKGIVMQIAIKTRTILALIHLVHYKHTCAFLK